MWFLAGGGHAAIVYNQRVQVILIGSCSFSYSSSIQLQGSKHAGTLRHIRKRPGTSFRRASMQLSDFQESQQWIDRCLQVEPEQYEQPSFEMMEETNRIQSRTKRTRIGPRWNKWIGRCRVEDFAGDGCHLLEVLAPAIFAKGYCVESEWFTKQSTVRTE
jgi:hypothetical protein